MLDTVVTIKLKCPCFIANNYIIIIDNENCNLPIIKFDEWNNFLERIGRGDSGDAELQESSSDSLELRFWASYRGQTLARTVRGMMYYRRALMLQSFLENRSLGEDDNSQANFFTSQGFELSPEARAQADIKFTYVISCQIYGQQKQQKKPEAADISLLLQRNEALRVAFIHVEESGAADAKVSKEFYSKLVKADLHGNDQEIYSIKLPGDPKLGEGKPENQNHAIVFTRGEAVQTIDMNQCGRTGSDGLATIVPTLRQLDGCRDGTINFFDLLEMQLGLKILKQWELQMHFGKEQLSKIPIWVEFYSVLLKYWDEQGLATLPSAIGRPLYTNYTIESCKRLSFARICVEIDVKAMLPPIDLQFANSDKPLSVPTGAPGQNHIYVVKSNGGTGYYAAIQQGPVIIRDGDSVPSGANSGINESHVANFACRFFCYNPLKPDNYLEEAMKMRNLLEEFRANHGIRPPTILGVREHVFTGSVSSLAWFMSNQETSFVTLGQRVLAYPLKVRMHYGHPDVFDRFNSTLRQGNITHHEYIQVGKGRDVGLNQIALFEGKVAGGNGEQVLSRDVYRIGHLFDFFRMLSFYFTTMTVLTVYVFLYGRAYLAFSGLDRGIAKTADYLGNTSLDAVLNAQFLVQIGIFTAVPMIMGFILELGLLKAVFSFITMQLQLCSVFFTFSLGTRTHYFGRTILHGGAKYRATGRGFVVHHIKFAENYRLYSRSHFVKALEVALLLIVYIAYGFAEGGAVSFVLLTLSSWFLVISWLFAPYIFNPSGFEWQKTVEDFDDWTSWLLYKGGVGVKGENSWESWWDEEQMHIQTLRGRILETILSLRFLIFQYGIVYKLHLTGNDTSVAIYGFSWIVLVGIVMIFKIFTFSPKKSTNFQLMIRFMQGVSSLGLVAALCLVVALTNLSIADLFASILAFIPTGWTILCLAVAWKKIVRSLGLWDSVREFARMYDAGMGVIIFAPIALLSWFPFISTFQSRLLFNQAFSRGLEISLILAGNKANVEK
ncbi:glucan synthase-like 8 [Actinidia rufa]|uniref:Glucan synthase-like 8 n=1 Tax=Actinidia rufa TaxID=165716 RepID=A0A7J0DRU6_9ERIC|nr:glucan synthase-like 8 [Actinidia rufa]